MVSVGTVFYYINKPVELTQNIKEQAVFFSDVKINKEKGFENFDNLIENAVVLKGIIREIKFHKNIYTLFVYSKITEKELICSFQSDQNKKVISLKKGDLIRLTGVYKGFLDNMIFQNCILN